MGHPAKVLYLNGYRGFESLPLRNEPACRQAGKVSGGEEKANCFAFVRDSNGGACRPWRQRAASSSTW